MGLINNNKEIYFAYLHGNVQKVIAQYVQISEDKEIVLNYLEKRKGEFYSSFTEIEKINGEWKKKPFHKRYDEYTFEKFDKEKSDLIIDELPLIVKVGVDYYKDKKEIEPLEKTKKKKDIYIVLATSQDEYIINKDKKYTFEFPFPAFYLENNNKEDTSKELKFLRCGLSFQTRNKIRDFFNNNDDIIDVSILPVLEYNQDDLGEIYRIHFVSCPNSTSFNNIYKSKSIIVDNDIEKNLTNEALLKKAFNNEISCNYESGLDNDVKHKSLVK